MDPILRNDCLSDHVHTFYGPQSGVDPRRIDSTDPLKLHSRLVATSVGENTGNVEENKSMYWHPTVYKKNQSTNTYTRDVMAQSSAYYVWDTGQTTAFPNGFQMISGFDTSKSEAIAECVNESLCDEGDCYTENTFFPSTKCDELEVSMRMPSCWDGIQINSPPDHTSHVEYSNDEGDCPSTHPVKIPQIHLFFRIMPYDGGWHTFADDSGVFHADYVSGWDQNFLQNVLDTCDNDGDGAMPNFFCEDMLTFRDAPKCTDESTCDFADPNLIEKVRAFQPNSLDIAGTIVDEETSAVAGDLPRGTCIGSFVGGDIPPPTESPSVSLRQTANPTDRPTDPATSFPTKSTPVTSRPTTYPTARPTPIPMEDEDENEDEEEANSEEEDNVPNSEEEDANSEEVEEDEGSEEEDEEDCNDDGSFLFKGRRGKDCEWIGMKERRSKRLCRKRAVFFSCPMTCGECS